MVGGLHPGLFEEKAVFASLELANEPSHALAGSEEEEFAGTGEADRATTR